MRIAGVLIAAMTVAAAFLSGGADAMVSAPPEVAVAHHAIVLEAEGGRSVAVTVYAPAEGCRQCTLIVFSHGALATPQRYDVLLDAWARRGFVVAAPLHTDSEEYSEKDRYPDSRATRLADWIAVDKAMRGTPLEGIALDGKVIAAGHSYGALIAEVAGGAVLTRDDLPAGQWRKPSAVIAISPPSAMPALVSASGFAQVSVPTLVVTGTRDVLPGFIDRWKAHLDSYAALAAGLGYALVFEGMDHNFNGAYCRPTPEGMAASAAQVERLNGAITTFIDHAQAGTLPGPSQWSAQSDAMARAEAK